MTDTLPVASVSALKATSAVDGPFPQLFPFLLMTDDDTLMTVLQESWDVYTERDVTKKFKHNPRRLRMKKADLWKLYWKVNK